MLDHLLPIISCVPGLVRLSGLLSLPSSIYDPQYALDCPELEWNAFPALAKTTDLHL